MNQLCTKCDHHTDFHTNGNGCTYRLPTPGIASTECVCTKYLPPSERFREALEGPVKLTGKQVYVAARNYIANELQITSGQILEMMAKRADKVVLAFLVQQRSSLWLKKHILEGIEKVIKTEVQNIIKYHVRVSVDVKWPT